jgi:8-oxo-dGTP diphosphatase
MRLFVVRHVKAGDRTKWKGPDHERPASKAGRQQADALADRLEHEDVSRLISSPSVRCVESLEPLAKRIGIPVETDDRLAEGSSIEQSLAVVREVPDGTVLCSHGDVVPDLIAALSRRGMKLATPPDWRKATLWILEGPGTRDGEPVYTNASVEPPPAID